MFRKIYQISDVCVKLLRQEDSNRTLLIITTGTVVSSGWSEPTLIPYYYLVLPSDGIFELDFVAESPSQPTSSVMKPIDVTFIWENIPDELKGIQVNSSTNSKTRKIDENFNEETPLCVWHRCC